MLAEEAQAEILVGAAMDNARTALQTWADLAEKGHLRQKETSLDAEFLEKIFGQALGYKAITESPDEYHREKSFTVPGAGIADGALGRFASGKTVQPVAVIELKGAETDLDHDKFNGRTPVQQCWDYLNQLPDTKWGIVSNYVTIRLYHKESPARAYEEFTVADFRDEARFRQFFFIFERNGLLGNRVQRPRADSLLKQSEHRQAEVGEKLYEDYSNQRLALIKHLMDAHGKSQDKAIYIAQKILDRIIFVAFCEDRALLPERMIHRAYSQIPAFSKVTNPRWQNFKTLFGFIDKGEEEQGIPPFNGGLFRTDDEVDELELDDDWTNFFSRVGTYDFRDEVNVDVLGHIFERSVTELEKLRVMGLFGKQAGEFAAMMPKSAERKRFGIYYTPPQFTRMIVDRTIGTLLRERVEPLADIREQVGALRRIKCVDPACGSGAFLIAAYDKFEEAYEVIARAFRIAGRSTEADALEKVAAEYILRDNLYGVDLSAESVEITQLALWIRSARKGRTLADLSQNIVCGNSLVSSAPTHERAFEWTVRFAEVFDRPEKGFDAVIGNPPWERMKLQEREFFAFTAPNIASAVSAADRRALISGLAAKDAVLWNSYEKAQSAADTALTYIRTSGRYPLTGRGDINTYMLFAELARVLVSPKGRVGLLVPSGIATDDTTKHFFSDIMDKNSLVALYDFENRRDGHQPWFPEVDGRFKFSVLLLGGSGVETEEADFVFFAKEIEELNQRAKRIKLSRKDLKLLNPNTRTCPIFRSGKDAEITKHVYKNVPVLVDKSRQSGGNPWGLAFATMFHQTNDAELFRTGKSLAEANLSQTGNRWKDEKETFLPIYEAKMIQAFDHRAAGVVVVDRNWMRQGQTEETSLVQHQNPEFVAMPRYWVAEEQVEKFIGKRPALLAFKDVTSATNQRTMIAAMVPRAGMMNSAPFIKTGEDITARRQLCLLSNLNSFVFDFIARQKVGGLHLNFFIVEQLPAFSPDRYDDKCPWDKKTALEKWIVDRALKLTCTAQDMVPLAEAAEFKPLINKWKQEERDVLLAELDAAYFILYGIKRDDVSYILDQFQGVVKEDKAHFGTGRTRKLILEAYDALLATC
ncbi:MAG: hypothetical protein JWL69_898 [Phycisphaerales bacterium]|nr:hypothetical protein [Phycisphaerales bacterium]